MHHVTCMHALGASPGQSLSTLPRLAMTLVSRGRKTVHQMAAWRRLDANKERMSPGRRPVTDRLWPAGGRSPGPRCSSGAWGGGVRPGAPDRCFPFQFASGSHTVQTCF